MACLAAQAELDAVLFGAMRARGFGDQYAASYRTVARFFQQRRPLVILVCGTAWTGV